MQARRFVRACTYGARHCYGIVTASNSPLNCFVLFYFACKRSQSKHFFEKALVSKECFLYTTTFDYLVRKCSSLTWIEPKIFFWSSGSSELISEKSVSISLLMVSSNALTSCEHSSCQPLILILAGALI